MLAHISKSIPKYARLLAKENFDSKTKKVTFALSTADKPIQRDQNHKVSETLHRTWVEHPR